MPAPAFAASSPEDNSGKVSLWSSTTASSYESSDSSLQCTPIPPSPPAQPIRVMSLPPGCRLVMSSPAQPRTGTVCPGPVQSGHRFFMSKPATSSPAQQPRLFRPATSWQVRPRLVSGTAQPRVVTSSHAQPRFRPVTSSPAQPILMTSSPAQPILVTSSPAQPILVTSSPAQPRLLRPVIPIPVQHRGDGLDEPGAYDNFDGAGCSHW